MDKLQRKDVALTGTFKPLDKMRAGIKADLKVKTENLKDEYRERVNLLKYKAAQMEAEYEFMAYMAAINSGEDAPNLVLSVQEAISNLTPAKTFNSLPIYSYINKIGRERTVVMLGEVIVFFTNMVKVKEQLDGNELTLLAADLVVNHNKLKILELFNILDKGTKGAYGSNFGRVDREVFYGWMEKHQEEMSQYTESLATQKKEHPDNFKLVDPKEKALAEFEQMTKERQRIYDDYKNRSAEAHRKHVREQAQKVKEQFSKGDTQ